MVSNIWMLTFGGGEGRLWLGATDEGLRALIVQIDDILDGELQRYQAENNVALTLAAGQLGKEAFDGFQPLEARRPLIRSLKVTRPQGPGGCGGGCEVKGLARVPGEPSLDPGVLVHGVMVQDVVDCFALGPLALDGIDDSDELSVVALPAAIDDRDVEHIDHCQGRRNVHFIDMVTLAGCGDPAPHKGTEPAAHHREAGLRSLQSLDLRLLVDRQHYGMLCPEGLLARALSEPALLACWPRRIDVASLYVLDLFGEGGSSESLNRRQRCGTRPASRQMTCTIDRQQAIDSIAECNAARRPQRADDTPAAAAIDPTVQCEGLRGPYDPV